MKEHGLRMTTMNNVVVKREFYIVNVLVKNDKKKRALVINQNSIGKFVVMALFYLDLHCKLFNLQGILIKNITIIELVLFNT